MGDILIRSIGFIFVIIIGFSTKRWKILKKEDGNVIATIVMNITLPCALLSSVGDIHFNSAMLTLLALGIICNVFMILVGYQISSKYTPIRRAAYMINCSGYSIGSFTLPFIQSFFPAMGIVYICMFDIGNAMMSLGGTYALALGVSNKEEKVTLRSFLKRLSASIPFMVYMLILILSLLQLTMPASILSITSYIGDANSFLVMLMIGLLLEIKIDRSDIKDSFMILTMRYLLSIILAIACYFWLPLPKLAREIMVLSLLAPVATVAPVFTKKCGYEKNMPAVVNSLSIIISIILNIIALIVIV